MMTGRNGLYFLLRLGRLSNTFGFQSETLEFNNLPVANTKSYLSLKDIYK